MLPWEFVGGGKQGYTRGSNAVGGGLGEGGHEMPSWTSAGGAAASPAPTLLQAPHCWPPAHYAFGAYLHPGFCGCGIPLPRAAGMVDARVNPSGAAGESKANCARYLTCS